ncbi:MAG: sigma-70 family RNA polymerase sigma factor [Sedimenticola sp.]|nr:sigma-70 family RNA polymerase sigma factor [Sedimenticola sp.]MCW8946169.1 sigma-70 family RNA polymerase sigma factor [Sedimenticola sp.]MCW8948585.1 sigma-70 family RNA polymerase sigma factor [Sedimenticola sp.]MCW8977065.1 sigma-70 family RNA polymerase sigma factor [Sedimenticola sp.]
MSNLALVQSWTKQTTVEASPSNNNNLFNELVECYSKDLQRYAHWLAGDKHTAEDLVQETLFRAWKSLHRLQNPKAAKGWLFTILRRENARRFERKQLQESDIPLETLEARDNYYDTSTEAFVLRRAIEDLPEEYREPLVQQVIGGYSQKEIADHLGLSSAGVGTRLFRARNKLKEALVA